MNANNYETRLNQINTLWTVVRLAHGDPGQAGLTARQELLTRYSGAIHRYLLGALHNADAADELAQEFACRFLHGDLRGVDRDRGRFRDFVKGVLFHLVADYHHRKKRLPGQMPEDAPEVGSECAIAAEREQAFRTSWRDELLARTWKALEAHENQTGQLYYTVLRYRAENPDASSTQLAEALSVMLNKSLTAPGVRKTLERARDCFSDMLLAEIRDALDDPRPEALEEELADLELLEQCRSALARLRNGKS